MRLKALLIAAATSLGLVVPATLPAQATEATFPQVADCSRFTTFYSDWAAMPTLYADQTRWVPQGLAYDASHHWLLTSYYDSRDVARSDKYRSMLVVTTLAGTRIKTLYFNTHDVPRGGHAGGLAVGRGRLWVATTVEKTDGTTVAKVSGIALTTIAKATNTATLPNAPTTKTAAASYDAFHANRVFVGDFAHDRVYRYDTTAKGKLKLATRVAYPTPTLVQGLAVTNKKFVFSRSYGRDRLSYLTVVDRTTYDQYSFELPNMSEGITWAPASKTDKTANLYVVFESASSNYADATCRTHSMYQTARAGILHPPVATANRG